MTFIRVSLILFYTNAIEVEIIPSSVSLHILVSGIICVAVSWGMPSRFSTYAICELIVMTRPLLIWNGYLILDCVASMKFLLLVMDWDRNSF